MEIVGNVRKRVQEHVDVRVRDSDAFYLSLASGSSEGKELIEFAHGGAVRSASVAAIHKLKLSDDEFVAVFGTKELGFAGVASRSMPNASMASLEREPEFVAAAAKLQNAIATTLAEPVGKALWQKSSTTRAAALVALLREDAQRCVAACVGGMIPGLDFRRLDDLKTTIEDEGIDVMLYSRLIEGLSKCVC